MLAAHSLLFGLYDPSIVGFSLFSSFQSILQLSMHETRIQCRSFHHQARKCSILSICVSHANRVLWLSISTIESCSMEFRSISRNNSSLNTASIAFLLTLLPCWQHILSYSAYTAPLSLASRCFLHSKASFNFLCTKHASSVVPSITRPASAPFSQFASRTLTDPFNSVFPW